MSSTSPPLEAQRFGRSQTPESPRPVHIPEPQNIPVLLNQMDPVFNDTATYNIPSNQTFSPYSDSNRAFPDSSTEEHDAVQNFLRGAEAESSRSMRGPAGFSVTEDKANDGSNATKSTNYSDTAHTSNLSFPDSIEHPNHSFSALTSGNPSNAGTADLIQPLSGDHPASAGGDPAHDQGSNINATAQKPQSSDGGVDYQSLLDTITQSASTAPAAETLTAPTTSAPNLDPSTSLFPSIPGLPPKPPPLENLPEFSNYQSQGNAQIYQPYSSVGVPNPQQQPIEQNSSRALVSNSYPPLERAFHQPSNFSSSKTGHSSEQVYLAPIDTANPPVSQAPGVSTPQGERPWTPKTQSLYDQFLDDERRYVTEGIWDRFPTGSRLFVGNLPSEKVTKRDLFHTFHRHGRLAQISIKQAYGFVQFLEASSCYSALAAEQSVEIRGRKVHLEISKPQKNTRNPASGGSKANARRRSRSPDRGVARSSMERQGGRLPFSDFRDEPGRRRDDYRPGRSPSPRGYRARDDYRPGVHSPHGYPPQDGRPRSPAYSAFPPPQPGYDEDSALPLPRRDARSIPDVQILILEPQVAHTFINWVEQHFHSKGLRASTIWLRPQLPLQAVVKRQIIEGVQAIVKLSQGNQLTGKIPLQVFDRSAGASNVNFNEYVDLDVPVAADIVIHARQKERGSIPQPPTPQYSHNAGYTSQSPYGPPHVSQQLPPQYGQPAQPPYQPPRPQAAPSQYPYPVQQPQYSPVAQTPTTPNANAQNLQQLLANLRQPQDSQPPPPNIPPTPSGAPTDLGGLLSNIAARRSQNQQYNQTAAVQPQPNAQGYGGGTAGGQSYGGGSQQNVQNIMEQLARYQR